MSQYRTSGQYQCQNFAGLYTQSPQMIAFMDKVKKVAATNASILVRGQSGTGKELVARYIHAHSQRHKGAFSALNCAALTGDLIASELFGHKKGAFTGAVNDRKGLLELTNGGTLFLDEIAEMPLDIQARLLRVFQERCYTPLGSSETLATDLRIVSATHESLRSLVEEKLFREDLMYRLRVIPMFIPSLIERDGDVEMLIWRFIAQLNEQNSRQIRRIHHSVWSALLDYPWPGNVRELQNAVEYMHAIGEGDAVEYADLPPDLLNDVQPAHTPVFTMPPNLSEAEHISLLLQKHHGKKQAVADELGISRATLWRKLSKLNND